MEEFAAPIVVKPKQLCCWIVGFVGFALDLATNNTHLIEKKKQQQKITPALH